MTDELYRMGFSSLRPREFISLLLAGEWKTAAAGDAVLTEGKPVSTILHRDLRELEGTQGQ